MIRLSAVFFTKVLKKNSLILFFTFLFLVSPARAETPARQAANNWNNTDFRIIWDGPGGIGLDDPLSAEEQKWKKQTGIWEAEAKRAAQILARQGFAEPTADWLMTDDQGNRVRPVYVFSFKEYAANYNLFQKKKNKSPLTNYVSPFLNEYAYWLNCNPQLAKSVGINHFVLINRDRLGKEGNSAKTDFLLNFVHETMHAVIQESRFRNSSPKPCKTGSWIGEGIPDAVAYDVIRSMGYKPARTDKKIGLRYYSEPLYARLAKDIKRPPGGTNPVYATSSFWRFLKSKAKSPDQNALADPESGSDYSFLARMFNEVEMENIAGQEKRELDWLTRAIKKVLKLEHAGAIYGEFITKYAAYSRWGSRLRGPMASERAFAKQFFEKGCKFVKLTRFAAAEVTLAFEPNAARCVLVSLDKPPADKKVNIGFTTLAAPSEMNRVRDIGIGTVTDTNGQNKGKIIYRPAQISEFRSAGRRPVSAGAGGLWSFEAVPASPVYNLYNYQLFVISNANKDLSKSRKSAWTFKIALTSYQASLNINDQTGAKISSPGSYLQKATYLKKSVFSRTGTEQNYFSTSSVQIKRQRQKVSPCKQKLQYCDNFEIALNPITASPLTKGDLNFVEQAAEFEKMRQPGIAGLKKNAAETENGYRIKIEIPPIEYGFAGEFDAAILKLQTGGRTFEAIGPRDVAPGVPKEFPPSAKIYIDEYSPDILRGRFEATLVKTQPATGGTLSGEYPSLPVAGTVTGEFLMVAPWQADEDFKVSTNPTDYMIDSVINAMPLIQRQNINRDELLRRINAENKNTSDTGSGTGETGLIGCSCLCRDKDRFPPDSECAKTCAEAFKLCSDEDLSEAEMERRYMIAIRQIYSSPVMQQNMLKNFRRLPVQERGRLLKVTEKIAAEKK